MQITCTRKRCALANARQPGGLFYRSKLLMCHRLLVSFARMSVRLGGVLMRLHRMLMGGHMIAYCMELGCCVVCLCCVLVMFRCFFVRFVCHKSPFVGTSALIASANLRVAPFRLRLCRIKNFAQMARLPFHQHPNRGTDWLLRWLLCTHLARVTYLWCFARLIHNRWYCTR